MPRVARGASIDHMNPTNAGARMHTPRRALLLSNADELSYRVMRCVTAAGLEAHVLGATESTAWRLARSKYCRSFEGVPAVDFATGAAVKRVNALTRSRSIDIVIATDPASTRFLVSHADSIEARHFPVLDAPTFERLVNKDGFASVCRELHLPHPETEICQAAEEALALLDSRPDKTLIVKPTDAYASHGVWKLVPGEAGARERLRALSYTPIVMQDFIEGSDLHVLLLCDAGRIAASITYQLGPTEFRIIDDDDVLLLMERISSALSLNGPIGFDMRRDTQGRLWLIECNPRFTHEGSLMCFLSGYSIVGEYLSPGTLPSRAPPATVHHAKLLRPWTLVAADRRHTRYLLSDARPNVLQACREFYSDKVHRAAPAF